MPPEEGAISALARRYRAREESPQATARDLLARAVGPETQSIFAQLLPERALREAKAAERRITSGKPLGVLDGIPITWKDAFDIAQTPTRMGSRSTSDTPACRDAACVARLRNSGAVTLGKTLLSEFAFSGLGINPHFGTAVQHARATGAAHLVGGSSSGAAAALRLGLGCVAFGTDTSGSIRVPAAWSGLIGFRPSQRRYSLAGVHALAPSLDTVGILARHLADLRCVDAVLRVGTSPQPKVGPVRLVLVESLCGKHVQPAVRENCLRFFERASRAGWQCERAITDIFEEVLDVFATHGTLVAAEAAVTLARFAEPPLLQQLDPFVQQRLQASCDLPPEARTKLLAVRRTLLRTQRKLPPGTVFVFPTVGETAPAIRDVQTVAQCIAANQMALRHTMPGSFLDMPGLALPSGVDEAGLPTSVLLCAPSGSDDMLLATAEQLEALQVLRA
jgi:aspartyl-tRNA(Asn)/glutamyl-tRNA(Gln) amidotransferase subunit A